jgi:hypothetical protein
MKNQEHTWFVFETRERRLEKSLSDLNGTDAYIHDGRVTGVFRELCNAFVRPGQQPSVQNMKQIHQELKKNIPVILKRAGTQSVFQASVFRALCVVAGAAADNIVK